MGVSQFEDPGGIQQAPNFEKPLQEIRGAILCLVLVTVSC